MTPTKKIHNKKVHSFAHALDRMGWTKVCLAISYAAADKLQLARDSLNRGQADFIVSDFLAEAETLGMTHSGNADIYSTLQNIK